MESPGIKVLLVDNYDSFTHNIAHCVRNHNGANLQIIEADSVRLDDIEVFDKIIFSPGPDLPRPGNVMEKILGKYSGRKSILGICLGFQAIYLFFGGNLKKLDEVVHGRKKVIIRSDSENKILKNLPERFEAGLYHSWIADPDYLPDSLLITALSEEGRIMGIRHRQYDIEAVQFHPESIMTPEGATMIHNWLSC